MRLPWGIYITLLKGIFERINKLRLKYDPIKQNSNAAVGFAAEELLFVLKWYNTPNGNRRVRPDLPMWGDSPPWVPGWNMYPSDEDRSAGWILVRGGLLDRRGDAGRGWRE